MNRLNIQDIDVVFNSKNNTYTALTRKGEVILLPVTRVTDRISMSLDRYGPYDIITGAKVVKNGGDREKLVNKTTYIVVPQGKGKIRRFHIVNEGTDKSLLLYDLDTGTNYPVTSRVNAIRVATQLAPTVNIA
jgi:hypothetical protein